MDISYIVEISESIVAGEPTVNIGDNIDMHYNGMYQLPVVSQEIIVQIGTGKYYGQVTRHIQTAEGFYQEQGLI